MAKKSMKIKQQREPKYSTRATPAARFAVVLTLTCATTASAVFASVSWLTRAKSPA